LQAFFYGAFTSLQYTSMNTLVYADTTDQQTSAASSIASTMQQMSISFGVASAGLATAFFVPSQRPISSDRDDPRHSQGARGAWDIDHCFDDCLPQPEANASSPSAMGARSSALLWLLGCS
jgi:hypothetical protein